MFQYLRNTNVIFLFSVVVSHLKGHDHVGDFHFVKCNWNGTKCVSLEKVNSQSEFEDTISEWPVGPYALPMPIDGCPESMLKGWQQGYMDFSWRHPHVVLSMNQSADELANYPITLDQQRHVTEVQIPEIQSPLIGPYSRYRIKLNFCFKTSRNETVDVGNWPDGNYSIYGAKTGCPNGFSSDMTKIKIGKVSHIMYDGHLPEFKLHRSDQITDYLEIRICTRIRSDKPVPDQNVMTYNDSFILLQFPTIQSVNSLQCPLLSDMSVTVQVLYVYPTDNSSDISELFRFCYFRPNKWKPDITLEKLEFSLIPEDLFVVRVHVSTGKITLKSKNLENRQRNMQIDIEFQEGITELLTSDLSQSTNIQWKLIDLGRQLSVFGIFVPVTVWPTKEVLRCYYSNGKLDFLHLSAHVCLFSVRFANTFDDVLAGYTLLFRRVIEGRYIAFVDGADKQFSSVLSKNVEVTVLTTNHSYLNDEKTRCYIDLGMIDHGINSYQISASSSLPNFPPTSARPFLSSWCASANDSSPWILINLYRAMRVEGITIYNREYVYETVSNGSVGKHFLKVGAKSFGISYGDSEDNLTMYNNRAFLLDAMYPVEDAQTFIFHLSFYAHFVKIHILESLTINLACIRFELHGCRKTGTKALECQTSKNMKRVPAIHNPMESPQRVFKNVTGNVCNDLCMNDAECSIANHLSDDSCLHYGTNRDKSWVLASSETNDMISSAKVCLSDYILAPYVAYELKAEPPWRTSIFTFLTYMSLVRGSAILTSIGFPFNYAEGENYKWLISFVETEFIKLVFTHVDMNIHRLNDETTFCRDQLIFHEEAALLPRTETTQLYSINENSFGDLSGVFIVDSSYNSRIFTVESEMSYLTLTFVSCRQTGIVTHKGNGFRVIVSKQDVPACLSLDNIAYHTEERLEYCDKPHMSLSSMTYLDIPFARRTEKWTIRKIGFLRINVVMFDIKCSPEISFTIEDKLVGGKQFCNLNRPPGIIYTSSGSIVVLFTSQTDKSGHSFRLVYTNNYETFDTVQDLVTSKGADIPAIYWSIKFEADLTDDVEYKQLLLASFFQDERPLNIPRLLYKVCSGKLGKCYSIFSYFGTWDRAGSECWIRRQRLVNIRHKEELKLIKYLLRNFKLLLDIDSELFRSAFLHNNIDLYYAYIGLHRRKMGNNRNTFLWENRAPVTFSDWKPGEPSSGDCTRMGFYMANKDRTWETVSCSENLAFYFVCETSVRNSTKDLQDRQFSRYYKGNVNVTRNGYTCQRWDSQYPHRHHLTIPDETAAEVANFCRDPSDITTLWCYTTDPSVRSDACYINELNEDISQTTYTGKLDKTRNGSRCVTADGLRRSYCRRRIITGFLERHTQNNLWCYVNRNNRIVREDCNLIDTASDRCWYTRHTYDDASNVTVSGKRCERWDLFFSQDKFKNQQFPDKNLEDSSNYCRDPTSKGFPWCYISYPEMLWEICNVEYGNDIFRYTEEISVPPVEHFECKDGNLVNAHEKCNGVIDCEDASDETHCLVKVHPLLKDRHQTRTEDDVKEIDTSLFFQCYNKEIISILALCDDVFDCQDASDEINCTSYGFDCSKDYFTCGDESCIHISLFCNFITDCSDSSDEACDYPPCSADEYTCANGQCIPDLDRCNAITNCLDGTDEDNCDSCRSGTFHCDYVRCLPDRLKCDTYPDCEDGSDEVSCDMSDMTSCRDWWDVGYRKSGMYKISLLEGEVTEVYCEFSFIGKRNELYTVFRNVDIIEWNGDLAIYTMFLDGIPHDEVIDYMFYSYRQVDCEQEVIQPNLTDYVPSRHINVDSTLNEGQLHG